MLQTSHVVAGSILNTAFYTEDLNGVGDTVNIFLFPGLSLYAVSEVVLVVQLWYTALDCSNMTTYAETTALLHCQKISPMVGWEPAIIMMQQWAVFLLVMLGTETKQSMSSNY